MPQRERAFLYIFTEMLPRVLSKIYAMKVLTNIIEIKKENYVKKTKKNSIKINKSIIPLEYYLRGKKRFSDL